MFRTEDISLGGLCGRGTLPFVDRPAEIVLRVGDEDLVLQAVVSWRRETRSGVRYGLRFVRSTREQRRTLRSLLRGLNGEPPSVEPPVPPAPRAPLWVVPLAIGLVAVLAIAVLG